MFLIQGCTAAAPALPECPPLALLGLTPRLGLAFSVEREDITSASNRTLYVRVQGAVALLRGT